MPTMGRVEEHFLSITAVYTHPLTVLLKFQAKCLEDEQYMIYISNASTDSLNFPSSHRVLMSTQSRFTAIRFHNIDLQIVW